MSPRDRVRALIGLIIAALIAALLAVALAPERAPDGYGGEGHCRWIFPCG